MFNPNEYQYTATLKSEDGELAILSLQNGAKQVDVSVPKTLLPKEIKIGETFTLKFLPTEAAKKGEYETLRKLLEDLIN